MENKAKIRDKRKVSTVEGRQQENGQIENPYPLISVADVFVLPSLSEGISRASLESLYLGIPCVLRNVDGNKELIQDGLNGKLFNDDDDLPNAMLIAAEIRRKKHKTVCLLPKKYRQQNAVNKFLQLN